MFESTYAIESISNPLRAIPEPVMTVKHFKERSPFRLQELTRKDQAKQKFAEY
jgi:hypothetical protein